MTPTQVKQVPSLTTAQIAQFKRDGFIVLPAALDPELCRRARDDMWETIATYLPRMQRVDAATWGPLSEEESAELSAQKPLLYTQWVRATLTRLSPPRHVANRRTATR